VDAAKAARAIVDDLAARTVGRNGSGATVSLGIGRPQEGVSGIRQSYQEARHALTMGRRLRGPGHLTSFDELGIHRLIFAAEGLPELRTFHDETLEPLLAYDRQHGADLLRTLEAFFAARCSPKEAAERLSVHRNTVLYRLDRIREITALDLDDADVRLRLHLALQVHLALYSGES
jgi:purine catabolism regulator